MVLSTMPLARGLVSLVRVSRRVERDDSQGFVMNNNLGRGEGKKGWSGLGGPLPTSPPPKKRGGGGKGSLPHSLYPTLVPGIVADTFEDDGKYSRDRSRRWLVV